MKPKCLPTRLRIMDTPKPPFTSDQKLLLKKRKKAHDLYNEIRKIEERIHNNCAHQLTEEYRWEHDNGYGRQTYISGVRCTLCGSIDHWRDDRFIHPYRT